MLFIEVCFFFLSINIFIHKYNIHIYIYKYYTTVTKRVRKYQISVMVKLHCTTKSYKQPNAVTFSLNWRVKFHHCSFLVLLDCCGCCCIYAYTLIATIYIYIYRITFYGQITMLFFQKWKIGWLIKHMVLDIWQILAI